MVCTASQGRNDIGHISTAENGGYVKPSSPISQSGWE